MDELSDIIYSKEVVEFITVSNQFCQFLENSATIAKSQLVDQTLKIGSLLYLKSSVLPEFEKLYDGSAEKFVSEIDWNLINTAISSKLGADDLYMDLFLPKNIVQDQGEEISYSEALSDIYQDLKDVATNYQIGSYEAINDALWECRNNFESYWGPRLLGILGAFHNLKYNAYMTDEESYNQQEKKNLRQQFLDFQKPDNNFD